MNKKILLCGNRSFVAQGLYDKLKSTGFTIDCFSRGIEERNGDVVTGDVNNMCKSQYLEGDYEIVINFIVIKDGGIEENIRYIKELVQFCKDKRVKRLIHISSIIVYSNKEIFVNEETPIEAKTDKSGYGAIKIGVDQYLESLKRLPFTISFIRPGYILADHRAVPFFKKLPLGFALIKGGKKSTLPIVERITIHQALENIVSQDSSEAVYLFVPADNKTKVAFLREGHKYQYLFLPKGLIIGTGRLLVSIRVLPKSFFVRIESMFTETHYDSSKTERLLKIKF